VGFGGIGIPSLRSGQALPMIDGQDAHATLNRVSTHVLKTGRTASRPDEEQYPPCRDNEQGENNGLPEFHGAIGETLCSSGISGGYDRANRT
jgi:hypothetical protein